MLNEKSNVKVFSSGDNLITKEDRGRRKMKSRFYYGGNASSVFFHYKKKHYTSRFCLDKEKLYFQHLVLSKISKRVLSFSKIESSSLFIAFIEQKCFVLKCYILDGEGSTHSPNKQCYSSPFLSSLTFLYFYFLFVICPLILVHNFVVDSSIKFYVSSFFSYLFFVVPFV